MIYTRWGNEVVIIGGDMEKGIVHVEYTDMSVKCIDLIDLKADGGINEITEEIKKLEGKGA